MDMSSSIRDRIFSAADSLYDEAKRQAFPTVDAVRKLAKVNMNDASSGMKEWRRAQSTQVAPIPVQVPTLLQQSSTNALVALWSEAMALANDTLRAAQTGWDAERAELEALSEQMASAYESQAAELEVAATDIVRLQTDIKQVNIKMAAMQCQVDDSVREVALAAAAARQAEIRTIEIERRADELRTELDHAHVQSADASKDYAMTRKSFESELALLRAELAQTRQKALQDGTAAQAALIDAREAAAALRGQIDLLSKKAAPRSTKHSSGKAYDPLPEN